MVRWKPATERPERMNSDKPHRCPNCHAVAIDQCSPRHLLTGRSVTCCRCGMRFTRWPWLVWRHLGVVCTEHRN